MTVDTRQYNIGHYWFQEVQHCLQDEKKDIDSLSFLRIDFDSSSRRSPNWRNYPIECNERLTKCAKEALGNVVEFTTVEELNNLPDESDNLKLQTLLIRLRILGPDHPDTIYYIRYRGAIYADAGNIQRCLSLWMYALELQKIYLEPLCHVAQSAFLSFAELFSYILSENYVAMPAAGLDPNLLIDCLELCVDSIDRLVGSCLTWIYSSIIPLLSLWGVSHW